VWARVPGATDDKHHVVCVLPAFAAVQTHKVPCLPAHQGDSSFFCSAAKRIWLSGRVYAYILVRAQTLHPCLGVPSHPLMICEDSGTDLLLTLALVDTPST
jgi:hypothetical protein